MRYFRKLLCAACLVSAAPAAALAASAALKSPEGQAMGDLALVQTADGVRISGEVIGLSEGEHAFHVHAVGKCEGPDFKSAGGHFNPLNLPHGRTSLPVHHAGDMDNLVVGKDGKVRIDVVNDRITLNTNGKTSVFDTDGSAIVIHAAADDYVSQPSGNAGGRVACGVIGAPE